MFRLCVAQAPADLEGTAARLAWLRGALPAIATQRADLVLLPELFACGYNIGDAVADRAEPLDGPTFSAVAGMAQDCGVAIHYGFAERDGDHLFNAAVCVAPGGNILCHHRKLAIPPGFERTHFKPGHGCGIAEYRGLTIATLICYDAEFPETVRHVAGQGADLVLVPTALGAQWGWVARAMIPTRAYENGVFLAYANSAGTERGMDYLGQSVIAAPDGVELARAGPGPELLFSDLDRARVKAARDRLPYLADRQALSF
ncbi:MAG: carbon-nitrogen hydrolase family protein [Pseudomonadota bacterium]